MQMDSGEQIGTTKNMNSGIYSSFNDINQNKNQEELVKISTENAQTWGRGFQKKKGSMLSVKRPPGAIDTQFDHIEMHRSSSQIFKDGTSKNQ